MSFNIDSSMIKLARDADEGIIPAEGQVSERGTVWKTGSGSGSINLSNFLSFTR